MPPYVYVRRTQTYIIQHRHAHICTHLIYIYTDTHKPIALSLSLSVFRSTYLYIYICLRTARLQIYKTSPWPPSVAPLPPLRAASGLDLSASTPTDTITSIYGSQAYKEAQEVQSNASKHTYDSTQRKSPRGASRASTGDRVSE